MSGKSWFKQNSELGGKLIAWVVIGGPFAVLVLRHFHQPGHYGVVEVLYGIVCFIWLLLLAAFVVALLSAFWLWLAAKKNDLSALNYILITIAAAGVTLWLGGKVLHKSAFYMWQISPLGLSYSDTADN